MLPLASWLIVGVLLILACAIAGKRGSVVLVAFQVTLVLLGFIAAQKVVLVFGMPISIGVFFYARTFIVVTLVREEWSHREALDAVLGGLVGLVVLEIGCGFSSYCPSEPSWTFQGAYSTNTDAEKAYATVLQPSTRLVIAASVAYVLGQVANMQLLVKTAGPWKHHAIWGRLVGSTILGHFVDTVVFFGLLFWGQSDVPVIAAIGSVMAIKILMTVADLPLFYFARWTMRVGRNREAASGNK